MLENLNVYRCICEKCQHQWNTKNASVPTVCAKCHSAKWNTQPAPQDTLIDRVKGLNPSQRLALFEQFELCCGMNRGGCICERPQITPQITGDKLADFIANAQAKKGIATERAADQWQFTKDAPQFAENGNVYRQQYDIVNPKRRRTVQVSEDDFDCVM